MGKLKEQFDAMYEAARSSRRGIQFSNNLPVSAEYLSKLNGTTIRLADWGKDVSPELMEYARVYAQWDNRKWESHIEFDEKIMKEILEGNECND